MTARATTAAPTAQVDGWLSQPSARAADDLGVALDWELTEIADLLHELARERRVEEVERVMVRIDPDRPRVDDGPPPARRHLRLV
jgi:hypothetical protein